MGLRKWGPGMKTWLLLVAAMTVATPVAAKGCGETRERSTKKPFRPRCGSRCNPRVTNVPRRKASGSHSRPTPSASSTSPGDGRDDYIVSLRNVRCHGREFVYCGTGGCEFKIIVALKDGGHRTVFSDLVRGYDILPGKGGKRIRFWLHGGYCGRGGVPSCPKTHRISTKPFAYQMPE